MAGITYIASRTRGCLMRVVCVYLNFDMDEHGWAPASGASPFPTPLMQNYIQCTIMDMMNLLPVQLEFLKQLEGWGQLSAQQAKVSCLVNMTHGLELYPTLVVVLLSMYSIYVEPSVL